MLILAIAFSTLMASSSADLKIIYTNDMEGSVSTCGCATDPGGGSERRINWLKKQKLDPASTIYINSGNTLFTDLPSLEHENKIEMTGANILSESMRMMKIDASLPGRSDLKKGVSVFHTASKGLPLVISNSDDLKFKKSLKIKRAGRDIVILGLIQPEFLDQSMMLELKLNDVENTLKKELKELGTKNRPFTILLLYSNEQGLKKIAKQAKGVDLILSAGIQEELPQAMDLGGVNVIRLLNGGDSIGLLTVKSKSSGKYTYENKIVFLGPEYVGNNPISAKIKKYEKMKK